MNIGIDLSITQVNQAGTAVYAGNLAAALDPYVTLTKFQVNQRRNMNDRKTMRSRLDTLRRDLLWTHFVLPQQIYRSKIDLLHMPANIVPWLAPCPTVVTILDTAVFQRPDHFP